MLKFLMENDTEWAGWKQKGIFLKHDPNALEIENKKRIFAGRIADRKITPTIKMTKIIKSFQILVFIYRILIHKEAKLKRLAIKSYNLAHYTQLTSVNQNADTVNSDNSNSAFNSAISSKTNDCYSYDSYWFQWRPCEEIPWQTPQGTRWIRTFGREVKSTVHRIYADIWENRRRWRHTKKTSFISE